MSKNKNIVIQKVEKGSTIAILDKTFYMSAIQETLIAHTKFSNLDIPAGKPTIWNQLYEINYMINLQKRKISDHKLLKNEEIID